MDKMTQKSGFPAALATLSALFVAASCAWPSQSSCGQIRHLASITANEESGPFGRLGTLFFDEERQRLYVADAGNHRILAYDREFSLASSFSSEDVLHWPSGIVRDGRNRFFVSEPARGRVLVLEMAKRLAEPLDLSGAGGANPVHPGNLALCPGGMLYVLDQANQRVLRFGQDLSLLGQIRPKGARDLRDVKIGPDGMVYLLDTHRRLVLVCTPEGAVVRSFGKRGSSPGEFLYPVSLAVDGKGIVYVLDRHAGRVSAFDGQGRFLFDFAGKGWLEGRLHYPSYILASRSGRLFVIDTQNARVSVFE